MTDRSTSLGSRLAVLVLVASASGACGAVPRATDQGKGGDEPVAAGPAVIGSTPALGARTPAPALTQARQRRDEHVLRPDTETPSATPTASKTPTVTPRLANLHDPSLALPPGVSVVWTDGASLWGARDAAEMRIADAPDIDSLRVAPTGNRVAYLTQTDASWALYVVDIESLGSPHVRMLVDAASLSFVRPATSAATDGARVEPWHFSWSADGTAILFTLADRWPADFGYSIRRDLWRLHVDSGHVEELLAPGRGGPAVYSPDGAHIAVSRIEERQALVDVADVAGPTGPVAGFSTLLRTTRFSSESDWTVHHGLQWEPTSAALLLALGADRDGLAYLDGPADLARLPLSGEASVIARTGEDSVRWMQFPNGEWAPAGLPVAWLAPRPAATAAPYPPPTRDWFSPNSVLPVRSLLVLDEAGSEPREIASVVAAELHWAPDGNVLLFRPRTLPADGRWRNYIWHTVSRGGSATERPDIGMDFVTWLSPDLLLLAQPEARSKERDQLVITHLDGRWRVLATVMAIRGGLGPIYLAATNDRAGVLSR